MKEDQNFPVEVINSSGGGITTTLDSHYYKGQGEREGTEREFVLVLAIGTTNVRATITDGDKAPTMLARAGTGGGNEPIVLMRINDESISNENRSLMCEQPSGQLHRTGCVQRYAPGVQEDK